MGLENNLASALVRVPSRPAAEADVKFGQGIWRFPVEVPVAQGSRADRCVHEEILGTVLRGDGNLGEVARHDAGRVLELDEDFGGFDF